MKILQQKDIGEMESEHVKTPNTYNITNITDEGEILRGDSTQKGLTRKHVPYIINARKFQADFK